MKITKAYAKDVLNLWKNETAYFDGSISYGQMESMLRYRMRFGVAETEVILMSLILAGAKFAD